MDRKSYPGLQYTKYTELLDPKDPIVVRTPDIEVSVPPEIEIPDPIDSEPPPPTERKNSSKMTTEEEERFTAAITTLISTNQYGEHVSHHAIMTHRMHGGMAGFVGYERFLSWHRIYLLKLEGLLRNVDDLVFIPYWDWTVDRQIPSWLASFAPDVPMPDGTTIDVPRNPQPGNFLPSPATVTTILDVDNWTTFVRNLEDGPHNRVHGWVGGRMNDILFSPADPLFWLHHAEVDRIWHRWQQTNPGKKSDITGTDAALDPWWAETINTSQDIAVLGYKYV